MFIVVLNKHVVIFWHCWDVVLWIYRLPVYQLINIHTLRNQRLLYRVKLCRHWLVAVWTPLHVRSWLLISTLLPPLLRKQIYFSKFQTNSPIMLFFNKLGSRVLPWCSSHLGIWWFVLNCIELRYFLILMLQQTIKILFAHKLLLFFHFRHIIAWNVCQNLFVFKHAWLVNFRIAYLKIIVNSLPCQTTSSRKWNNLFIVIIWPTIVLIDKVIIRIIWIFRRHVF